MDLAAAHAYLDRHTNFEAGQLPIAGRDAGLSLDRMQALVSVMGDPQHAYPVIHLTGTNGKGSTGRLISAILAEGGLTVGTYTSPHLERLNERICRNLEPIDDDALAAAVSDVAAFEPFAAVTPTYFEIVTAAAFGWFADVAVDVAVIEVGLLGRYDATNVADGAVAVVTNVGHDHTDFDGDWRRKVAEEKAGIIKPASTLVLGETDPRLVEIFEAGPASQTWMLGRDFSCGQNRLAVGGRLVDLRTPEAEYDQVFLPLHGAHQGDNALLAVSAIEAFFGQPVADDVVRSGLANATVPGRFEVVGHNPLVVLDGAHNLEGAAALARTLHDDFSFDGGSIIVAGLLRPRDPADVLGALDVARAKLVIACEPESPRAVAAEEVAAAANALGGEATMVIPDVVRAVDQALAQATADDAVIVTGSLYVVGAARGYLRAGG